MQHSERLEFRLHAVRQQADPFQVRDHPLEQEVPEGLPALGVDTHPPRLLPVEAELFLDDRGEQPLTHDGEDKGGNANPQTAAVE